jgi:vancomycin permeability regulator SanA
MNRKYFKTLGLTALGLFALGAFTIEMLILLVQVGPVVSIDFSPAQIKSAPVAIVLGAGVLSPTRPSDALYDRLVTAADLYHQGIVSRVLLTGDGGAYRSDEISVMQNTMVELGVPLTVIDTDREGFRTYESCKRAAQLFGIKQAIVITQRYHLARSLFLCQSFGLEVTGVAADRHMYIKILTFSVRELLASVKAAIDVFVLPPDSPVALVKDRLI